MIAAQIRGSVKVRAQPENGWLDGDGDGVGLLALGEHLEQQFGAAAVEFHVAELVDAEQVDTAVAGDGLGELSFAGGLDQLDHQLRGQRVADPVALLRRGGPEPDEQVGLAGTGVADQAARLAGLDPRAAGERVDRGGVASKSKSSSHFSRGNPAALTRRAERRRSRSSHSESSSSARNPR
ncbi:hypothetical protein JOF36_007431 [Pseudonocardia parietis]|uniref:Uncharacterized protein n=1 Tax=Pseudonocardia parietis TaxID=570936 RepID=A0ABS4W6B4_9PSEU|nr:hypothetical protein [Pseudonocardia parietis]